MSCTWSLFSLITPITDSSLLDDPKNLSSFFNLFLHQYCPQVVTSNYAFQSFREDVSVPWLVSHIHEPAEQSVDSDLFTNPSRVVDSNGSMTGARKKSLPDMPQMPGDPGPSDLSSSSYDTASPLHFHGLADTQTQTQLAFSTEATGQSGASRVCIPPIINIFACFLRQLTSPLLFRRLKRGNYLMIPSLIWYPKLRRRPQTNCLRRSPRLVLVPN